MQRVRGFAGWAVIFSLLSGIWLPVSAASRTADRDGICGPVLILEHSVQHFEASRPQEDGGHCVLCHWWNTLASATPSTAIAVAPSADPAGISIGGLAGRPHTVDQGARSPRGPPASR